MNKILGKHSALLFENFEDFAHFDFNKELAEKMVSEEKVTLEDIFANNKKLALMIKRGVEIMPLLAVFEKEKGKLTLKSKRFFEIIRFSLAISSFVRGIDQFSLACRISELDCPQFSVFAYYSSIFHLMHSFIAVHGRVYIPKTITNFSIELIETSKEGEQIKELIKIYPEWNKFVKGIYLAGSNEWFFQNAGVSHTERWKDFADVLKLYLRNNWRDQIPQDVIRFWGYVKVLEEYRKNFYKPRMRYSIDFSSEREIINTLNKCYGVPAEIRHQKIYGNKRYDIMALPYWRVGKIPSHSFIEAELNIFKDCNENLLRWQYSNLKECLSYVESHCSQKDVYYKGLNAITKNTYLASDLITRHFISESKEVVQIDKNILHFVELLLT